MNRIFIIALILAVNLLASFANAQGSLYLSNLGQTPFTSGTIGSDSWIAQWFTTGTNPGGYIINSVQLLMDTSSGSPNGLAVSIYSSNNFFHPGSNLGNLNGLDPSAGETYNYTADSSILLSPDTPYFIVSTATTTQGAFNWSAYNTFNTQPIAADSWSVSDYYDTSTDGSNWTLIHQRIAFQFAIYATPVPEPVTWALAAAGLMTLGCWRRKWVQ